MADFISITVEGGERLQRALTGLAQDTEDFRPWRAVEDEVYSIERRRFATRGDSDWPAHADSTVERIRSLNSRGFTVIGELERATDTMFRAVTTRGAPHGIREEEPMSLTLGVDLKYARLQQTGTSRMPQRKIYDLSEGDADRLAKILKRGLVTKIADRGFDFVGGAEIPF